MACFHNGFGDRVLGSLFHQDQCLNWSCSPAPHGRDGNSGEIRCPRDGFFCRSWSLSRTSDFKFLQDFFGLFGHGFSLYFLEECVFNQLIANCIKLKPERIDKNSFVKKRKRIIGVFIHIVDFREKFMKSSK